MFVNGANVSLRNVTMNLERDEIILVRTVKFHELAWMCREANSDNNPRQGSN